MEILVSISPCPGFEALTEIQNLLNTSAYDPSVKESLIIDASNRFFTVIPSIHPHVIRDEDDFKSKVQILLIIFVSLFFSTVVHSHASLKTGTALL